MAYINLLIKIKNASVAQKKSFKTPFTKMDNEIANVMKKMGFLNKVEVKGRLPKKIMEIDLNEEKPILGLKLVSRPSKALYAGYKKLKPVKNYYGFLVLSTPKGIMIEREAKKAKVGGKLLFEIW